MATLLFPVARHGQLVRALDDKGIPRALTLDESQKALEQLQLGSAEALSTIQLAMKHKADGVALTIPDGDKWKVAPGGRAHGLGVIFNYPEFVIELDLQDGGRAIVIVRCTVTLCLKPPRDLQDKHPYSKFWTRFFLLEYPPGEHAANIDDGKLARFSADCKRLSDACMNAMAPLYEGVLKGITGETLRLNWEDNFEFDFLTIEARGGDAPAFFEDADLGVPVTKQAREKAIAKRLFGLAAPAFELGDAPEVALKAFRDGEDFQVLTCRDGASARGVFLAHIGPSKAQFIGFAMAPERSDDPPRILAEEARHAPSNAISAWMASAYARHF